MTTNTHEKYMQRAIDIARLGIGNVWPNPAVGAVIVHNDCIIGEGYHQKYGDAHAEVQAVRNISPLNQHLVAQSTLYVTLEPCFHTGKTPPCVNLVLKHGIKRVVIACMDPNPLVAGQSIAKLQAAGVEVISGILYEEARSVAAYFFTSIEKKRPYIILKWAQSADGFIGQADKQVWLTNEYSKRLVHKWRSEVAAIAVGSNTLRCDNPCLTTRLWPGSSPIRVTWLRNLASITPNITQFNMFKNDKVAVFLFCEQTNLPVSSSNMRIVPLEFGTKTFFQEILAHLHTQHIDSILIEGGCKTLQAFIDNDLWDEARVFTTPHYLQDGIKAPVFPHSPKTIEYLKDDRLAYFYK
jgi:diaminohydroxyphosphoribosylaminopyrimidine deaminase / 5-amino-6-(5-phosphoribosylamino)uracil reductase